MIALAVLGAAEIAERRMLPAVEATPGVRLAVIASRRPYRAAELAARFGAVAAPDYGAVLERDDVDAVYLPLPNALHEPWAERALLAGKHVFVEKPLATTAEAVERLQRLAAERSLVLRENMMFVHHRQHAEMKRLVEEGLIGAPLAYSAEFTVPPRTQGDIRLSPDLGGGALLDTGVYPIRGALLNAGPRLEFAGAALRMDRLHGVDVGGAALLLSDGGMTIRLEWGHDRPYRCRHELVGPVGRLTVDRVFTPPPGRVQTAVLTRSDGAKERFELSADDQFAASLAAFRDAIVTGASDSSSEMSLAQARLVDHIAETARRVDA